MKKTIFLAVLLFTAVVSHCQELQKGYYITNANQKVEGYFKPGDFSDASSLQFKRSLEASYVKIPQDGIIEYSVDNVYRFEKHLVEVDVSSLGGNSNAGYSKEPQFVKKDVFLEVVLESDATLYAYNSGSGIRYFYKVNSKNIPVSQLVYKTYKVTEVTTAENAQFRQQLFRDVTCAGESINAFLKLKYDRKSLIPVFEKYNECSGYVSNIPNTKKHNKAAINYTLFLGVGITNFGIDIAEYSPGNDKKAAVSGGIEASLTLPSQKWSLFARGEYEQFSGEVSNTYFNSASSTNQFTNTFAIDYKSLNFYFGPRYNFVLNTKNKLFIDVAAALAIPLNGNFIQNTSVTNAAGTFDNATIVYDINSTMFVNFGVGYIFNNKFGVDVRLDTNRDFLDGNGNVTGFATKLSRIALNLRYSIN